MRRSLAWLPFALAFGLPSAAVADPRLDEVVYDPYVQNGVLELEARGAQALGGLRGGASATVLEQEYGVSDRISLAVVETMTRSPGQSAGLRALGVEGIIYVGQIPRLRVDTGLYLEVAKGFAGSGDFAEAKVLFAKNSGRFQGLVNIIVEEPIGAPMGQGYASYGYAASATVQTWGALRLGAEAFGDFGNDHAFPGCQGAYVGPQMKCEGQLGKLPVDLGIDAGWLAAVGTSRQEAKSELRLAFELEHHF